jgi:phosphoenolpyruvate carboxykinase (ATP)
MDKAETSAIPYFGLAIPKALPKVDTNILDPRNTYANKADWETKAKDLAGRFIKNFEKFTQHEDGKKLLSAGPKL